MCDEGNLVWEIEKVCKQCNIMANYEQIDVIREMIKQYDKTHKEDGKLKVLIKRLWNIRRNKDFVDLK